MKKRSVIVVGGGPTEPPGFIHTTCYREPNQKSVKVRPKREGGTDSAAFMADQAAGPVLASEMGSDAV